MRKLVLIAAVGKNGELGNNNELIWKIPEDMQFFKENTINKHIIMGMNTFKSLPKLLPNRKHIVLTSKNVELNSDVIIFHSKMELLEYISSLDEEVMVIGGAQMYSLLIEEADKMFLTEIESSYKADTYFPSFNKEEWNSKIISEHDYQDIHSKHLVYTRK